MPPRVAAVPVLTEEQIQRNAARIFEHAAAVAEAKRLKSLMKSTKKGDPSRKDLSKLIAAADQKVNFAFLRTQPVARLHKRERRFLGDIHDKLVTTLSQNLRASDDRKVSSFLLVTLTSSETGVKTLQQKCLCLNRLANGSKVEAVLKIVTSLLLDSDGCVVPSLGSIKEIISQLFALARGTSELGRASAAYAKDPLETIRILEASFFKDLDKMFGAQTVDVPYVSPSADDVAFVEAAAAAEKAAAKAAAKVAKAAARVASGAASGAAEAASSDSESGSSGGGSRRAAADGGGEEAGMGGRGVSVPLSESVGALQDGEGATIGPSEGASTEGGGGGSLSGGKRGRPPPEPPGGGGAPGAEGPTVERLSASTIDAPTPPGASGTETLDQEVVVPESLGAAASPQRKQARAVGIFYLMYYL